MGRTIAIVVAEFTVGGTAVSIQSLVHFSKITSERDD
jgi:hypothetical protein